MGQGGPTKVSVKQLQGRRMPFRQFRLVNLVDENVYVLNLRRDLHKTTQINQSKVSSAQQTLKLRDALVKAIRADKPKFVSKPRIRHVRVVLPEGSVCASQFGDLVGMAGQFSPRLFMYGGLSNLIRVSMIEAVTCTGRFSESFPWKENHISLGRFGHTMHAFNSKQVLVYGGHIGTSRKDFAMSQNKLYRILGVFLYHIQSRSITRLTDQHSAGPRPRKFHASCVIAHRFLLVFGGTSAAQTTPKNDKKSSCYSDMWVFDCARRKWFSCVVTSRDQKTFANGIMFHRLVCAYQYSIDKMDCFAGRTHQCVFKKSSLKLRIRMFWIKLIFRATRASCVDRNCPSSECLSSSTTSSLRSI